MSGRSSVGGVYFHQVVAPAFQGIYLFVAHALRQSLQIRILVEEMLAVVAAVLGRKGLHLPVYGIGQGRSEEHTSELQSLMRISYAVLCLKKKKNEDKLKETKIMHNTSQL